MLNFGWNLHGRGAGGINANKIFRINWNQSGCWVTKFNQKEIIRMLWKRSETFIHIPQHFWHKIAAYQKYLIEVWRGEFFLRLSSSSFIQCGEHTSIKCDLLSGQKTYSQPNKLHVRPKKKEAENVFMFYSLFLRLKWDKRKETYTQFIWGTICFAHLKHEWATTRRKNRHTHKHTTHRNERDVCTHVSLLLRPNHAKYENVSTYSWDITVLSISAYVRMKREHEMAK